MTRIRSRSNMQTLPSTLLKPIHQLRASWWKFKMRVPARYIVHAVVLIVAVAVAFQNAQGASVQSLIKESDRLARYFELPTQNLITEKAEEIAIETSDEGSYYAANLDIPRLALASGDSEIIALASSTSEIAVTSVTALAKPAMSQTALADHPRQAIISYAIQSGDTISTIAEEFGLSVQTLLWANKLSETSTIKPGANLKILPTNGVVHTVADGDTLESIAKKYQASLSKISDFNNIQGDVIKEGQELIIPGGRQPAPPKPAPAPSNQIAVANSGSSFGSVSQSSGDTGSLGSLVWPSACSYISQYRTAYHTGIDIACPHGSGIFAADGGTVISAGWEGCYGNSIVVNHGWAKTRYGHLSSINVRVGQSVSQGQRIADEGTTGCSSGPHNHFEVMVGGVYQNPLSYL